MTEDRPKIGRLDEAIDRAVGELTAHEAPADLRARVLARLEGPASAGASWSPGRMAAAAAAISLVALAAYLAWPPRPVPVTEPKAVVTEARPPARPPAATPAPPEEALPAGPTPGLGAPVAAATPTPSPPPARIVTASAATEPGRYQFRSPRDVARLDAPGPIDIDPMPPEAIDVTPVTVEPLVVERLAIEPIHSS